MSPHEDRNIAEDRKRRRYEEHIRFCVVQLQCALSCVKLAGAADAPSYLERAEGILDVVARVRARVPELVRDAEHLDGLAGMVRVGLLDMRDGLVANRSCLVCRWRATPYAGAQATYCTRFPSETASAGAASYPSARAARASVALCASGRAWEARA